MRQLGRFLLAAKSLDPQVLTLQDILAPPKFSFAVKAAKKTCGLSKSEHRHGSPSLAFKLGISLKAACDIVIAQYVQAGDETAAGRARSFLDLLDAEWDLYVSCCADFEEDKWNEKDISLTEDVMKLHKMINSEGEKAKQQLLEGPNPEAYKTLSESLLSQIKLFNRRRQGEVATMPLQTYIHRTNEVPNEDVMQCLSPLEKNLSEEFTRFVIGGKGGQKVCVLLTKEMMKSLDFLVDKRGVENFILDSNRYVFARQNSDSHLRGSSCLRKHAIACEVKRPETLTLTQLGKHVATLSQLLNLKDDELDQLAKFVGYDITEHRKHSCLTENTLLLAKMSKSLMAMEPATETCYGKIPG